MTTFIVSGDSFITRRISEKGYAGFSDIRKLLKAHDVRFTNFEMTAHDCEGSPTVFHGGAYAMTTPCALDDMIRFGFNIYSTANNHSFDYGHGGLLATIDHFKKRNMLFCGTGEHLAAAAAPVYIECPNSRVALIGVCSSFDPHSAASSQSAQMPGRPGVNPLGHKTYYHLEPALFKQLEQIVDISNVNAELAHNIKDGFIPPLPEGSLVMGNLNFKCDTENKITSEPNAHDLARILRSVREAAQVADYVLVSLHAHEFSGTDFDTPADFLVVFAHECIDAGASVIIGHGPHKTRGLELYHGGAIFYSLGNFIYQGDTIAQLPAESFEAHSMSQDATVGDYMTKRSANGTRGFAVQPDIWQSVLADWTAENGKIEQIRLYPITLHMELPPHRRGFPALQPDASALDRIIALSRPFGTEIDVRDGVGYLKL